MSKQARVRLEIRSVNSPDIEFYSWIPTTNAEVYFLVEMEIGQVEVNGADLFQVVIATPEALRAKASSTMISDRSTVVVSNYDWNDIRCILEGIVKACESETWVASTLKLQRYFRWEYEDYQMEGQT